ncbi:MAG: polysaccharide biosynthesis tyrosine autokinase [candidate division KSB1 bacterium]|nr:polysaccharide biosynthesis tyrosine autokinase [candidate division KSB1 bacterium]
MSLDYTKPSDDKEWGLQDYWALAVRRKWIIIGVFFLVFISSLIYLLTRPPVYVSSSTFILESIDAKSALYKNPAAYYYMMRQTRPLAFYETLLRSKTFYDRVSQAAVKDSALTACREFDASLLPSLFANLRLTGNEQGELLYSLSVEAPHPTIAYRFAVIALNEFKRRCQEIEMEESRNIVDYVNVQIEEAKKNLEKAERELQEFKERTRLVDIDQIEGGLLKKLSDIESQLEEVETQKQLARANLNAYQARFSSLKQGNMPSIDSFMESPEAQKIRQEIDRLEEQKRRLSETEGLSSPALAALDSRIEEQKAKLRQAILASRERSSGSLFSREEDNAKQKFNERIVAEELNLYTLDNKERYLRNLIEKYRSQNPNILEHAIELAQLQRTKKVNENLYTYLVEKAEEAKINAATGSGGVRVVDEPSLPLKPKSQNRSRNIAVAFILSLGLGFGLAFVRDYLDNSIYSVEDIQRLGDLTVLGAIPEIKTSETQPIVAKNGKNGRFMNIQELYYFEDRMNGYRNKVISLVQDQEPLVDAYRHVRTNLQFADVDNSLRRLLVTSSIPGEGKTLTTANLAISFAELGKRVLVVEADLRKPHMHILFNLRRSPGLADYLARDLALDKVIYLTHVPNVFVIPAGTVPPNPGMILASQKMSELITKLEHNFDIVLCDTPPVISVTDAVILSKTVGNVILVVRFGKTNRHIIKDALQRLEFVKSQVRGIVLNGMEKSKGYGYYRYDYSYYASRYYTEEKSGGRKKMFSPFK